ncbi:MAG: glycosyltransferase [Elusimicrobiota bacterium]
MNKPFTLFHIDAEPGLRGGERQLLYLACALRDMGHRNIIAVRRASRLAALARDMKFDVLELGFYFEFDPSAAIALRKAARKARRPIFHAHTAHAAGAAVLAKLLGGPPVIAHRRVDFPLRGRLSRIFKYGQVQRVICVSDAIRKILIADGMPEKKLAVVHDAVPCSEKEARMMGLAAQSFAPVSPQDRDALRRPLADDYHVNPESFWIGNLAALVPHKDHDTLIAAAFIVLSKKPNTVFLIAGEGPLQNRLLEQIRRMGLVGKVLLLGQRSDSTALIKSLDLFVLSSWGEGMGSVILEAMACGVPVAATTAGGIPEITQNGKTGILSPPKNPEALAAAILRLMEDHALRKNLARCALEKLPEFGISRAAKKTEAIYEEIYGEN